MNFGQFLAINTQRQRQGWFVSSLALILCACGYWTQPVRAEGSNDLTSFGGNRPYLLWSVENIGGILHQPIIEVYAQAGETINLGSSAVGMGGRIEATNGSTTITCDGSTGGQIANRDEETGGPDNPDDTGYTPCQVNVTAATEGIWEIKFISANPSNIGVPPVIGAADDWTQANNVSWIAAWDITVRNASDEDINGRVFLNQLPLNMGGNNASFNSRLFVLTNDGFIYQIQTNPGQIANGFDPFRFIFFSNNKGFRDGNGEPIFRSLQFQEPPAFVGNLPPGFSVQNPNNAPDSSTDFTNQIFINQPDSAALSALNRPFAVAPPPPTNLKFTGDEGTDNQAGTSPLGGTFSFQSSATGSYRIIIDANQDGVYGNANDRILLGSAVIGTNTIDWDGNDGAGIPLPASTLPYQSQITLFGGEAHFPLFDPEQAPGGIQIQRIKEPSPPSSVAPPPDTIYYDDQNTGNPADFSLCAAGETGSNCYGTPPNPRRAIDGTSSTGGGHRFDNNFGNLRGIDTWVFYPSEPTLLQNAFEIKEADLSITKTASPTVGIPGRSLTFTVVVTNNGPSNVTGARVIDTISPAITEVTWTCTASEGSSCPASGNGDIDTTVDLLNGGTATFTITGTLSSNPPNQIANTGTVLRPDDVTDPDDINRTGAGNNSATATVPIGIQPQIFKSIKFIRDNDGTNTLTIGDDVEYKVIVRNPNNTGTINNVIVSDIVPIQIQVFRDTINVDSPPNSGFALSPTLPSDNFEGTGTTIQFTNGGTLPPNSEVTITYNARILPGASSPITNQALANFAGDGGNPIRSDASDSTNPAQEGSGNNPGDPRPVDQGGDVNQPVEGPETPTILNFVTPVNPAGTKSVRLFEDADGSGSVSTGDILEYTITYTNTDPNTEITNFQARDEIASDALRFVPGSYNFESSGSGTTVTANLNYNGTTNTNLNQPGNLGSSGQVVFTYRTEIIAGPGIPIRNQAIAFTDNTGNTPVPTDAIQKPGDLPQTNNSGDPSDPGFDDPTVLTVEDPMTPTRPVANKSVRFLRDNDNSGSLTIGDDIQYTIITRNANPTQTINEVILSEILPVQVRVLRDSSNPINVNAGFSLASSLPISSFNGTGNPIRFTNPGTLPPTGEVVLTFNARILPGAANPITNQGLVNFEGSGGNPIRTDASDTTNPRRPGSGNEPGNPDPVDTGGNVNQPNNSATDPTILNFVSPVTPTGSKSVRLVDDADGNGSVTTGDTLEYTVIYTNPEANAPITNVLITDQIEADKVSFVPDSYNFRRVDGSGTAGNTTTVEANPSFNGTTDQNLSNPNNRGQLGTGGGQVMIMYSVRVTAGAGTQIQNQATAQSSGGSVDFSLTDALSGLGDDGTPSLPQINDDGEDLGNLPGTGDDEPTIVTVGSPGNPRLRLVKRITNITRDGVSISGIDFNSFNDDPANPDDDAAGWAQRPPVGIIQLGPENTLQSGDNVEYTIYFLSDGGTTVNGIQVCDAIPEGTTFISDSVSPGQGILLNQAGIDNPLTNALDADLGTFFGELDPVNTFCPNPNNPDGSVLVNVGNVSTISPDNIGFVRFRVRID